MLLFMALFFGVMYLYCWFPELIGPYKEKRREKREREKDELRKKRRADLLKITKEKGKVLKDRHDKIQEHLNWLEGMNAQIKDRFNLDKETSENS